MERLFSWLHSSGGGGTPPDKRFHGPENPRRSTAVLVCRSCRFMTDSATVEVIGPANLTTDSVERLQVLGQSHTDTWCGFSRDIFGHIIQSDAGHNIFTAVESPSGTGTVLWPRIMTKKINHRNEPRYPERN